MRGRPWHREHQMQGNAKLLRTMNMGIRGRVGDDGIGEKGLLRQLSWANTGEPTVYQGNTRENLTIQPSFRTCSYASPQYRPLESTRDQE